MNPQVFKMVAGEITGPISVGRTSEVVRNTLQSRSPRVWLTRETLAKQLAKHPELALMDYHDLEWALNNQLIVRDRIENRLHIVANAQRDRPRLLKLTIKNTTNSERLFLISAHWIRSRSLKKLIEKAPDLPLKW